MPDWYKPATVVSEERLESRRRQVRAEAQRRIERLWPVWAQVNAMRGVYGKRATDEMAKCVDKHRAVARELLTRKDLSSLDVTRDDLWPKGESNGEVSNDSRETT